MHKIPSAMATQHPDNASGTYFDNSKFISVNQELEECFRSYNDLGCDEYMFDWEGKFADSSLVEKLYRNYNDFFTNQPLGNSIRLTMRIPNKWEGYNFSLPQAFMSILTSKDFVSSIGIKENPIFEIILPMTKNADQLIETREAFQEMSRFKEKSFHYNNSNMEDIEMIPLFEGTDDLCDAKAVLEDYFKKCTQKFKKIPAYMRPFMARSDPAMNSGLIPAVISCQAALSNFRQVEEKHGVPMYPIIGCGSLPMRGGMNPYNLKDVLPQYKGVRTVTLQSAFRYDYPLESVKEAIAIIKKELPKMKADILSDEDIKNIKKLNKIFEDIYRSSIENIANFINEIADHVPSRRERVQHIGLLGYGRGVGNVKLPRAIKFTAALYSIGLPPEFIGLGRALKKAKEEGLIDLIYKLFRTLQHEIRHAGKYLNHENIDHLCKINPEFKNIRKDINLAGEILNMELGPIYEKHFVHRNLSSTIYYKWMMKNPFLKELEEAGEMRRSLG